MNEPSSDSEDDTLYLDVHQHTNVVLHQDNNGSVDQDHFGSPMVESNFPTHVPITHFFDRGDRISFGIEASPTQRVPVKEMFTPPKTPLLQPLFDLPGVHVADYGESDDSSYDPNDESIDSDNSGISEVQVNSENETVPEVTPTMLSMVHRNITQNKMVTWGCGQFHVSLRRVQFDYREIFLKQRNTSILLSLW